MELILTGVVVIGGIAGGMAIKDSKPNPTVEQRQQQQKQRKSNNSKPGTTNNKIKYGSKK